jgi:hypothetical protein
MSPITQESELGRILSIKDKLFILLSEIITIINLPNPNLVIIRVKIKALLTIITKIKKMWTNYLRVSQRANVEQHIQANNDEVNISIFNIIVGGEHIKNTPINNQTLTSVIINLISLKEQTLLAIGQVTNLEHILDIRDISLLASNRVPRSAPPRLQRQSNIHTRPPSLFRQPATHSLLEHTSLTDAFGKKYLKKKQLTRRKKGKIGKKSIKGGSWSLKYKRSINCKRPRGFSQKQYCKYGKK